MLNISKYPEGKAVELRLVRGQGGTLSPGAQQAVVAWLAHRGEAPGPLLLPVTSGGRVLAHRPLSEQAIYHLLRRLGARADLAPFSPRDLRRNYIGDLLEAGADLVVVQRLVATPARHYRLLRPQARASAAERLQVPVG